MHLILSGGRVIDPATGHDAVADVRILERDGTLVMRSTMTGPLAEMLPDPVQEHVLTPVKEGEFALRQEGQQNWNSLVFYTLPTGEPYMHFGVRAAPKVAS
ncbi:hypothetical protein GCM10009860_06690 [Microbacterium mitrae]|uniref:Uncharacterized protein n=1 Tax=Microbacterium mitrae TaxID=664640 RepID=A0A5C8HSL0_9MICO|nr:hypothetical protein [Microbacterium mitrae]TXK06043.1 hypothetical protein FVP60_03480 [Microbacterium mitrae]